MAVYPKVRCPVCGMIVWLKNVQGGKRHRIQMFKIHYEGYKKIYLTDAKWTGDFNEFWIAKLLEVLNWLGWKEEEQKQEDKEVQVIRETYVVRSAPSIRRTETEQAPLQTNVALVTYVSGKTVESG